MKRQGISIKTLLIAAAVYTLALGAPVKRDTSFNTVTNVCSAAKNLRGLAMCSNSKQAWVLPIWANKTATSTDEDAAGDLWEKLTKKKDYPFNRAVSGAVQKCFNNSDHTQQKCKLAAAAITLHDTIKDFITEYLGRTEAQEIQTEIDCNTTTPEVQDDVAQTLCPVGQYILNLLKEIDNGRYCNDCQTN